MGDWTPWPFMCLHGIGDDRKAVLSVRRQKGPGTLHFGRVSRHASLDLPCPPKRMGKTVSVTSRQTAPNRPLGLDLTRVRKTQSTEIPMRPRLGAYLNLVKENRGQSV